MNNFPPCSFKQSEMLHILTFGGFVLGAVVATQAGMEWAAETLVVENGEGVETDTGLVVKLATVWNVAATHLSLWLLTDETWMNPWENKVGKIINMPLNLTLRVGNRFLTCAAFLTEQLVIWFKGLTQTVKVKHPTTLAFTGHQVLTSLLTHL